MQCWKSYEADAIISILKMSKLRLSDIQKHHQGIEWMTKVRLPRSRTETLGHYNMLPSPCYLASATTFLISIPTPHLPSKVYSHPSCLPVQTPMSWVLFLACHAQLSKGGSKASWDCRRAESRRKCV